MKIYRTIRGGSFLGVFLMENTLITVYSKTQWSTNDPAYRTFNFCGDIVTRAGNMLEFLYESSNGIENKDRILNKIAIMWERQPYMMKKVGKVETPPTTEKTALQKIWEEMDSWEFQERQFIREEEEYNLDESSPWAASPYDNPEEDVTFLTR